MNDPEFTVIGVTVNEHVAGAVTCKEIRIPAGVKMVLPASNADQLSVLISGRARIDAVELDGPAFVAIPAETVYEVVALTDVVWACVRVLIEEPPV